ncbi:MULTISPECIES: hypothetical protein, partial [unclassified Gilliamella]|uniref:hypothetical protein n=1 Tax=unclassified Gilliamella TaxID=2685620 RepID=UPI001EF0549E
DNNRPCTGAVGATPSSSNNVYERHIGAGFFAEWGNMRYYADAGFVSGNYWTGDRRSIDRFYVHSINGTVRSYLDRDSVYGVCTAP